MASIIGFNDIFDVNSTVDGSLPFVPKHGSISNDNIVLRQYYKCSSRFERQRQNVIMSINDMWVGGTHTYYREPRQMFSASRQYCR